MSGLPFTSGTDVGGDHSRACCDDEYDEEDDDVDDAGDHSRTVRAVAERATPLLRDDVSTSMASPPTLSGGVAGTLYSGGVGGPDTMLS